MSEPKSLIEQSLSHRELLDLRNKICDLHLSDDVHQKYRLQGTVMAAIGLSEYIAHYPNDTWVGVLRAEGWKKEKAKYEQ